MTSLAGKSITTLDMIALIMYFVLLISAGFYSMFKYNRSTVKGYFLASRQMPWICIGASLFASNIGAEHFIGLASSGAAKGLSVGAFELNAIAVMQILGWVFLPVFISSGVSTLPQYMSKRFGGQRIRVYLACLYLLLYILTKISVNIYASSLFINYAFGWNLYLSVLLVLGLTALCTVTGGLATVIYTDSVQACIMLIGGFILMIISFNKIGGISNLYRQYLLAVPSYTNSTIPSYTSVFSNQTTTGICGKPSVKSFQMLRSYKDPDMPWLGFFLGHTPNTIWYWCSDQMMVQRVLAAKTLSHARGGTLLAGYLKILPLFMIILPGMISRSLFPNTVGCNQPSVCEKLCNSKRSCTNIAYPALILNVLPDGLKGIMLAVMLAALISGLTSIFNSASTLFTIDIYPNLLFRRKDKITNRELMIVGRLFVILMTVFGIAWIPIVIEMQGSELYIYMQQVIGFLAPPIACIYILAILWKRANEVGAFSGLMVGFAFGLLRMILEFSHIPPLCGQVDRRLLFIRKINFMYYAIFLFWLTLITCVIVSLCTKPPTKEQLFRTTYWTRKQKSMNRDLVVIELPDTVSDVAAILNQPTYEKTSFEYDSHNSTYQSYPVCEQLQPDALLNSKPDQTDQKYLDTGSITRICTARTSVTNMDEISSSSKNIIKIPRGNRRDDSCMAFKYLKQFGSWFCGLEEEKQTAIVNEEKENSLNEQNQTEQPTETRLIMLKQRSHIKWILNINLLILILIEILLFVLFSLPAKYTFLRNN